MIETYFDRADAALGYPRRHEPKPVWEDPRYYCGQLYATMIDRNVAEAKNELMRHIAFTANNHRHEVRHGIRMGSLKSIFVTKGTV